jgi:ABC-2 type transport system permease protein
MAGLGEPPVGVPVRAGALSSLARVQYGALAAMRWSMFRHGMRTTKGAVETAARAVVILVYSIIGLVFAAGFGGGAYAVASHGQWQLMPLFLWVLFFMWQIVPVSLASFQQQFDLGGLLRFPVSFGTFYVLHLIFGLVDVSTIMGGFCCLGILIGITIAHPGLFGWTALSLVIFAAFNILLVRAIFAWIDRWLGQRRTREILTALFLAAMLAANFLNPAFHNVKYRSPNSPEAYTARQRQYAKYGSWFNTAVRVQSWLPPGLAARALQNGAQEKAAGATEGLALLGIYAAVAGGVLGFRLGGEYRGENLGEAPARKKVEKRTRTWLLDGSGPIAAVMEKELRTVLRALPLLYGLGAPLIMVFIFSGLYRNKGSGSSFSDIPLGLLLSLAYAMVGFTQLLYNNLGTEGAGIQILFLSPTPIRTVLLAKNLFHSLLFAVDAALVCIIATLRYGTVEPVAFAASVGWLLFALPVHLAAGNAFSINMPYRVNMGRISRQKGSQANALLSLAVQLGVLGAGAAVFAACAFFGRLWLAIPIFLVLAVGALFTWFRLLPRFEVMANERRDDLIATLVKAE